MRAVPTRHGVLDQSRPINRACPLTRRVRVWYHFGLATGAYGVTNGLAYDLTRKGTRTGRLLSTPTWTARGGKPGLPGAMVLDDGNDAIQTPQTAFDGTIDQVFTEASAGTVLLVYRKHDTTARAAAAFGVTANHASFDNRIDCHLPFSDGTIYWDFGGATEGASRLSLASHTFDTDWHWWAFVAGGGQGMRIYKDGKLLASNSATPTRNLTRGGGWYVGRNEFAGSDLADVAECVGIDRALTNGEVIRWMQQSKAGHPDTLNWLTPYKGLFFGDQSDGSPPPPTETRAPPWLGRSLFGPFALGGGFPGLPKTFSEPSAAAGITPPVGQTPPWFGRSLFGAFGIGGGFPGLARSFTTFAGGGVTPPEFVPPPAAFRPLFDQLGFLKGLWPRVSIAPDASVPNPPPPPPPPDDPFDPPTPGVAGSRARLGQVVRPDALKDGLPDKRDKQWEDRLRRFTQRVSGVLGSLMEQGFIVETAPGEWELRAVQPSFSEARAPGVDDDELDGVWGGAIWTDTGTNPRTAYICVDPAAGAAVWRQIT